MRITTQPQEPDTEETISDLIHRNKYAARRMNTTPPERFTEEPAKQPRKGTRQGRRVWFPLLVGFLLILGLILFWKNVCVPWWGSIQDQWHYGDARLTQFDANVGHGGISHFVAEYYRGSIVVIEIPLDHPNAVKYPVK